MQLTDFYCFNTNSVFFKLWTDLVLKNSENYFLIPVKPFASRPNSQHFVVDLLMIEAIYFYRFKALSGRLHLDWTKLHYFLSYNLIYLDSQVSRIVKIEASFQQVHLDQNCFNFTKWIRSAKLWWYLITFIRIYEFYFVSVLNLSYPDLYSLLLAASNFAKYFLPSFLISAGCVLPIAFQNSYI